MTETEAVVHAMLEPLQKKVAELEEKINRLIKPPAPPQVETVVAVCKDDYDVQLFTGGD